MTPVIPVTPGAPSNPCAPVAPAGPAEAPAAVCGPYIVNQNPPAALSLVSPSSKSPGGTPAEL